ncbi:MAG: multiprotein-bridging factor 1 family protein [Haloferacaceae archaeon]
MAKYSTGSGRGGGSGENCELCGKETSDLREESVAGATLLVCEDCASHGDTPRRGDRDTREGRSDDAPSRKKRAAQNAARMYDASKADARRWEREGTDYEEDRLPYLVADYGDVVARARQDAGLTLAELAAELDVDEDDLLAVEQGRATRAGVGGSVVRTLEDRLGVRLAEE